MYDLLKKSEPNEDVVKQFVDLLEDIRRRKATLQELEDIAKDVPPEIKNNVWKSDTGRFIMTKDMKTEHLQHILDENVGSEEQQRVARKELVRREDAASPQAFLRY